LCQFSDAISLPLAKTGLALFFEDKGDIYASVALDLGIAVKELQAKLLSELVSNGGLARAHGPDQVDVRILAHGDVSLAGGETEGTTGSAPKRKGQRRLAFSALSVAI
jgi:hypothetical protein